MRLRKRTLKNEERASRRNAPGRKGRNIAIGVGAGTGIAAGGLGAGAVALQGRKLLKTHGNRIGENLTSASVDVAKTARHAEKTARIGREAAVGAKQAKRKASRAVKRPFSAIGRLGKRVGGKVAGLAKEARFRYGGVAKKLLKR
jgi:hypothetical protein